MDLAEAPEESVKRKDGGRSSFKKMWSLRRKSRDKLKEGDGTQLVENEEGNDKEKKLSTAVEPVGSLEGV